MPRRATGQVIEPTDGRGWAIRFRAYGKRRYVTLGTTEEGWNRRRAEAELRHVLADVERGIWQPYEPRPAPEVREAPTFHEFASKWMENREPELRPKTVTSYRWMLSGHLLPHFARMRLDRIGPEDVDRYKATKLREGALGPNQINKFRIRALAAGEAERAPGDPGRRYGFRARRGGRVAEGTRLLSE
jgi:Phage integrase, N-terminal SAM-like domain